MAERELRGEPRAAGHRRGTRRDFGGDRKTNAAGLGCRDARFQHLGNIFGIVDRLQPAPRHRLGFVPHHAVTRLAQQVADQAVLVPAVGGTRRCGRDIGGMMDDGDHAA
ncbi:hypothetical protein WR25_07550 [Diploscapter pachys]|uniref:Uncharacterized protein n=1 Tax=Diploscapter pachys TaxID=2018661 RepID=A0A2A2K8B2_9BILA|nr:hypothetical protein WR25_07550 [Diploscapter pachys]